MKTIEYRDGCVRLIDQTLLPGMLEYIDCHEHGRLCRAISTLSVRGAPAIGIAGAYGVVLAARELVGRGLSGDDLMRGIDMAVDELRATRPTAVNLGWALDRMASVLDRSGDDPGATVAALEAEAERIRDEDERANRAMGEAGAQLIPDGANVLTHCNAGALATGEFGTAVGVIVTAHREGKRLHVWVDETRPLLQGARLTAWELEREGIPYTLITDNMAAHFMSRGKIDLAIVGADRIAANGDTANKIGTYGVAVLAKYHHIPFYVAAPTSTIDPHTATGHEIVIEERGATEVTSFGGVRTAPQGAMAANPAFDVTPAALVSAIVTEAGVFAPPYSSSLREALAGTLSRV